jgi:hypothetical protein
MSAPGQKLKSSMRANVFRFAPESRHHVTHAACPFRAINGQPFAPFDRLASGSGTQLLECRAFQTVEVAFARRRLLKNMLRHFQRRYRLSD